MMAKAKILIVEDDVVVTSFLKLILTQADYEIAGVAKNSSECFAILESEKPDLILMDISLPDEIDGIELSKRINQNHDLPIIFLTSLQDESLIERSAIQNSFGFIKKEANYKEYLPTLIEFALYKFHQERQNEIISERLRDSEEKFRSIASNAKDAIVFIGEDFKVSFINDAAVRIFGYSYDEAVGKELHNLIAPLAYKDVYEKAVYDQIKEDINAQGITVELPAIRKDGTIFPIELTFSSAKVKSQNCVCSIIRDISSRKQTEEELEKLIEELQVSREVIESQVMEQMSLNQKLTESEEKLQELNISKDKFFSIIAHDLKSPFQGLIGYSEMLHKNVRMLDIEDIEELADDINQSATHLYKLLENLLQWSRLQRGKIECNPENFSLCQLVELNIGLLRVNAEQKSITLINNIPPDLYVFADSNAINTTLRNLISNAVKFTHEGGKVTISAKLNGKDEVVASVSDNGVGMEQADIAKIFKIDSQHTTVGTSGEKGTGLGLVLCKELIENTGGVIWVESQPGIGSNFFFTMKHGSKYFD